MKRSGVQSSLLVMCRGVFKLLIPHCLCLHRSDEYLVDENCVMYLYDVCAVFSQGILDGSSGVCSISGKGVAG